MDYVDSSKRTNDSSTELYPIRSSRHATFVSRASDTCFLSSTLHATLFLGVFDCEECIHAYIHSLHFQLVHASNNSIEPTDCG